jgi:SAM-dependent methyltransferase
MTVSISNEKLNAFVMQVMTDFAASSAGFLTHLGHKLGLYKAMAGAGHLTARQIANRADCAERYTREWLNSQAAGGYIEYRPEDDTYQLPAEHALVLADDTAPCFLPPALEITASMWFDEDKTLAAFRSGRGIPWGDHHPRLFHGVAEFFRGGYQAHLVDSWLPALDGVVAKLRGGAAVADIGCGHGHSTVMMAKAFPASTFHGYDPHRGSVEAATTHAAAAGVADRCSFAISGAQAIPDRRFDLVCFFDCLHDLGDPVGAAHRAAEVLTGDGTLMVVEPFAGDRIEDNLTTVGRAFYSASTVLCCAHSLSEDGRAALGAQAGERLLAHVLREAGFRRVRRAAETPFHIVLEARV